MKKKTNFLVENELKNEYLLRLVCLYGVLSATPNNYFREIRRHTYMFILTLETRIGLNFGTKAIFQAYHRQQAVLHPFRAFKKYNKKTATVLDVQYMEAYEICDEEHAGEIKIEKFGLESVFPAMGAIRTEIESARERERENPLAILKYNYHILFNKGVIRYFIF